MTACGEESGLAEQNLIDIVAAFASSMTSDRVLKEQFVKVMRSLKLFNEQSDDVLETFFDKLDPDNTGDVHAEEMTTALALFTAETRREKLTLCFSMYDNEAKGIKKEQVESLFRAEFMGGIKAVQGALEIDLGNVAMIGPSEKDAAAVVLTTKADDIFFNLGGDVLVKETTAKAFFANKKDPLVDPEVVLTHTEFKHFVNAKHFISTTWFDALAAWEKN